MGSFEQSISDRLNDKDKVKDMKGIGEGMSREHPLSNKTKILENMRKREEERTELYNPNDKESKDFDLEDESDENKKEMLKNQLNTMYKEIQYMQKNGLWRELKEVREMFLKASKLFFDEEYRQKDDMGSGQIQYNQLKVFVNRLLQFVVAWQCTECNINNAVEKLIQELSENVNRPEDTTS